MISFICHTLGYFLGELVMFETISVNEFLDYLLEQGRLSFSEVERKFIDLVRGKEVRLCVKKGNENGDGVQELIRALQTVKDSKLIVDFEVVIE